MIWLLQLLSWTLVVCITNVTSSPIKNIVVLVLENRSFDTFLGSLSLENPNSQVNGLRGHEYNICQTSGKKIRMRRATSKKSIFDPEHSTKGVNQQLFGTLAPKPDSAPTMSGFVDSASYRLSHTFQRVGLEQAAQEVMTYFTEKELPVFYNLTKEYAVIDSWFGRSLIVYVSNAVTNYITDAASVPGPTYVNRHFVHCATAGGITGNFINPLGFRFKTIYDNLNEANKTWKIYASGLFQSLEIEVLLYRSLRSPKNIWNLRSILAFKEDARDGTLPQYSFIEPDFSKNDFHPPHSLYEGEKFLKEIYESLRSSPQWNETVLLVTFEEHGGYYDHVPPPSGVPAPDDNKPWPRVPNFNFDRLGVRVPTLVISPYVEKGALVKKPDTMEGHFEHSSIPATVKKMLGLPKYLTRRDAWAATFDVALTRTEPRSDCPLNLPDPSSKEYY